MAKDQDKRLKRIETTNVVLVIVVLLLIGYIFIGDSDVRLAPKGKGGGDSGTSSGPGTLTVEGDGTGFANAARIQLKNLADGSFWTIAHRGDSDPSTYNEQDGAFGIVSNTASGSKLRLLIDENNGRISTTGDIKINSEIEESGSSLTLFRESDGYFESGPGTRLAGTTEVDPTGIRSRSPTDNEVGIGLGRIHRFGESNINSYLTVGNMMNYDEVSSYYAGSQSETYYACIAGNGYFYKSTTACR